MVPPKLCFLTPILHPNIDSQGFPYLGCLCNWSPALNLRCVLYWVLNLLAEPHLMDGAQVSELTRAEFGELSDAGDPAFVRKAREWTRRYASFG